MKNAAAFGTKEVFQKLNYGNLNVIIRNPALFITYLNTTTICTYTTNDNVIVIIVFANIINNFIAAIKRIFPQFF